MADAYTNGTGGGKWNDPTTWQGGAVPGPDDRIIVKGGDTLIVEGVCEAGNGTRSTSNTPSNAAIYIEPGGTLKASRTANSELRLKGQVYFKANNGNNVEVDWGKPGDPIPHGVTARVVTNHDNSYHLGYYYGFYGYNYNSQYTARFYAQGGLQRTRHTYLTSSVSSGSNQIEVADATNWQVGDKLYISPAFADGHTYPADDNVARQYELVEIQAISGTTITLTANLEHDHGYSAEADKPAAVVANLTSNVIFDAGGDDRYFYGLRNYRGEVIIRDVEFAHANNPYNYIPAPIQIVYGAYYGSGIVERVALWGDSRGATAHPRHLYSLIYFYSTYKPHDGYDTYIKDTVGAFIGAPGTYRMYYPIVTYYGGRPTRIENTVAMGGMTYKIINGMEAYQQPSDYKNCKVIGASNAYHLHNNVDVDTEDCWAIGSNYAAQTYNGTAIHRDLKLRFVGRLADIINGWRGGVTFERPDYEDRHLGSRYEDLNLAHRGSDLPDGNYVDIQDNQNDPTEQTTYYSFGTVWWDKTVTRNDPHSIGMQSLSDTYVTHYEKTFDAEAGKTLLTSVYVRNITTSYVGSLTLKIVQGSEVIAEQTYDLTALTPDQWTLLSVSGTATQTRPTTLRIEYVGNGGQIALTDFVLPFTADQVAQAKAVWAEAVADNQVTGSFGAWFQQQLDAAVSSRLANNDARLDHLDADVSSRLAASAYTAPDNASIGAIKAKTDNLPNNPASTTDINAARDHIEAHGDGAWTGEKNTEAELHSWLDSYTHKNDWKADVTGVASQASVDAIKAKTDKLTFDASNNVQARVNERGVLNDLSEAQVKAQADQALTDYDPPTKAELDAAEANIRGADNDTLKVISDQLDGVQADLDNPGQYKADVSALALEATAQAIKSKTDALPADPASQAAIPGDVQSGLTAQGYSTSRATKLDDLDNLDVTVSSRLAASAYTAPDSKADIASEVDQVLTGAHGSGAWVTADTSALALQATLLEVKTRTDLIPDDPATQAVVQQVAADVWARTMEGTLSYEAGLRIMLAVLAGKVSGAGTGTERFRDQADIKDRVVSHVDSSGNRTSVEVDGS